MPLAVPRRKVPLPLALLLLPLPPPHPVAVKAKISAPDNSASAACHLFFIVPSL